ncbi:uncharacterized protein LOC122294581 [Carya illinoinensis]|uniref:uncharacterized protein LOC122291451 n=1 Tax=Carya illinoinensis TaxID=32201 RepID=UPI001C7197BB|nr:uncharacterized protein LOC122291451 [Carya illinoinensis]XP_042957894.1 uncharacterized protein LOC122293396 [Carya illinoinensis]XP_042959386.1 uncharacterized protein LOC122294581 [Carya illinoinensis]
MVTLLYHGTNRNFAPHVCSIYMRKYAQLPMVVAAKDWFVRDCSRDRFNLKLGFEGFRDRVIENTFAEEQCYFHGSTIYHYRMKHFSSFHSNAWTICRNSIAGTHTKGEK